MKRFLLFFLCISFHNAWSINLKLLKGTSSIIPLEYSPVMGISTSEWKLSQQWYRMSAKHQLSEFEKMLQNHPDALKKNPELAKFAETLKARTNSSTENLIMSMYHIVRDSFAPTNAPDNPVRQLNAHQIGQILKMIQDGTQNLQNNGSIVQQRAAAQKEVNEKLLALTKENNSLNGKISKSRADLKKENDPEEQKKIKADIQNYQERIDSINLEKKHYQELQKITDIQDSQEYMYSKFHLDLLTKLNSFAFKNEKSQTLKWKRFVDGIVGALKESIGDKKSYPENTVQTILLGYLLDKANTREDLQQYFRGFLGENTFMLPEQEYTSDEIEKILEATVNTSNFDEFSNFLTTYTFMEKYNSDLPKVVDNNQVIYKGNSFADCMDNTLRMLANIVTYDKANGEVGVIPDGLELSAAAHTFYKSNLINRQASEVGNSKVHQAWVNVIENLSGCVYENIGNGKSSIKNMRQEIAGFMPVDSEFQVMESGKINIQGIEYDPYEIEISGIKYTVAQKKVGDATYILIPKKSDLFCFEMLPSNLNIVTGLNHIFNLNLYSNINDIFNPNFISENFEKICQKFSWKLDMNDVSSLNDLSSMNIPIETAHGKFFINITYKGHGYVTVEDTIRLDAKIELSNSTRVDVVVPLIASGLKTLDDLPANLLYLSLFKAFPVLNENKRIDIYVEMLVAFNSLKDAGKSYFKSLIISFSSVEIDDYLTAIVRDLLKKKEEIENFITSDFILGLLYAHDLRFNSGILLKNLVLLSKNKFFDDSQILQIIHDTIDRLPDDMTDDVVTILSNIVKKPSLHKRDIKLLLQIFEKVIMNNPSVSIRYKMIELLSVVAASPLIDTDTASTLLPIIEKIFNGSDIQIKYAAFSMLEHLITNNKLSEESIWSLLGKMKASNDLFFKLSSMYPIRYLVDKNLLNSEEVSNIIDFLNSLFSFIDPFINEKSEYPGFSPAMLQVVFGQIMDIVQNLVNKKMITLDQLNDLEKNIPDAFKKAQKEKIDAMKKELSESQREPNLDVVSSQERQIPKNLAEINEQSALKREQEEFDEHRHQASLQAEHEDRENRPALGL